MGISGMIELFGYLGALLFIISMLMSSVIKLRVISLIGSLVYLVYALRSGLYPLAVLSVFLAGINVFYLIRLLATEGHFELIRTDAGSELLEYFLTFYQEDIRKYFPEFQKQVTDYDAAFMVCSDTVPAGILLGRLQEDGTLDTVLDYATPGYRDCRVGRFLYEHLPERGVMKLVLRVPTNGHEEYLRRMGFTREDRGYVKEL